MPRPCRTRSILIYSLAFALPFAAYAQSPILAKAAKPPKTPYYVNPSQLDLTHAIPPPPAQDSPTTRAELAEIHAIERSRTPALSSAAEADDKHEDIFLYQAILGPHFNPSALPLTYALSQHIRNDVSIVDGPLKTWFHRPRPYNFDRTLHPICSTNQENSYPSGHAFNGYLYAFTLTQLVPEHSAQILARADDYSHNRTVCEAHYPSDLEASRRAAYILFGALLTNPRFSAELAAARAETRAALNLQ